MGNSYPHFPRRKDPQDLFFPPQDNVEPQELEKINKVNKEVYKVTHNSENLLVLHAWKGGSIWSGGMG